MSQRVLISLRASYSGTKVVSKQNSRIVLRRGYILVTNTTCAGGCRRRTTARYTKMFNRIVVLNNNNNIDNIRRFIRHALL